MSLDCFDGDWAACQDMQEYLTNSRKLIENRRRGNQDEEDDFFEDLQDGCENGDQEM